MAALLDGEDKARGAQVVLMCGGEIGDLPVARLEGVLAEMDEVYVHFSGDVRYDEDVDNVHPKDFARHFEEAEGIIFVPKGLPGLSMQSDVARLRATSGSAVRNLEALVRAMIKKAAGTDAIEEAWDVVVGTVSGSDITREVAVIQSSR